MKSSRYKKRGFGIVEFIIIIALIAIGAIVVVSTVGTSPKKRLPDIGGDIPAQSNVTPVDNVPAQSSVTPDFDASYSVGTENGQTKVTISVTPINTPNQPLNSMSFDLGDLNSEMTKKSLCHAEIDLNETGFDTGWNCSANGSTVTCSGLTPFEIKKQTSVGVFLVRPFSIPDPPDSFSLMINEQPIWVGLKF